MAVDVDNMPNIVELTAKKTFYMLVFVSHIRIKDC